MSSQPDSSARKRSSPAQVDTTGLCPPPPAKKSSTAASAGTASGRSSGTTTPISTAGGSGGGGSASKPYKGLRHFSMMVCKKVEEKGVTTYNEVADELVHHVVAERRKEDPNSKFDEKNIRRRVYDALNVLMAMDIITKDKKAISWKGLPTSAHADLDMLEREKEYRMQEVQRKRQALDELIVQQVCFRNLVALNHQRGPLPEQQPGNTNADHKIPLPFIAVNTQSSAVIQCNMSRDLTDVMFDFSEPFEINDDHTILKRLGMHKTNRETLQEMFPQEMVDYAERHGILANLLSGPASAPAQAASSEMGDDYGRRAPAGYM